MSGRGRSRQGRSSGRGNRQGRGKPKKTPPKEAKMEFAPQGSTKTSQQVTFETVKNAIIQTIQRTYKCGDDIADSLEAEQMKDLNTESPTRSISVKPDAAAKEMEQKGFDIEHTARFAQHLEREELLRTNTRKAYALIFQNYCNKAMRNRIEQHPDFDTKIKNNPIELLKAIKQLMHDPVRARYPFASLTETMGRVTGLRQREDESLLDYVKRFKQQADVFKSIIGKKLFDEFIESTEEYRKQTDANKQTELKKNAYEQWIAYLILRNSDQSKYGSLVQHLTSQFSLGTDIFPKTIATATDALSEHRFDNRKPRPKKRDQNQQPSQQQSQDQDDDDVSQLTTETSFAQIICYCCGEDGHKSDDCPKRGSTPQNEWYINRARVHYQAFLSAQQQLQQQSETTADDASQNTTRSARSTRTQQTERSWSGCQINLHQKLLHTLHDELTLDTGSKFSLFSNKNFLTNIRKSTKPVEMLTNAGNKRLEEEGTLDGFDPVYYDDQALANIVSFSELTDKPNTIRIQYDSDKEDAFVVTTEAGTVKFARNAHGLYTYRPSEEFRRSGPSNTQRVRLGQVGAVAEILQRNTQGHFDPWRR